MMPLTETGAITPDGALWLAPLIGFAFGFLLERAGLAYAPRLAGQFYFRDFTVFKVLFTALVTAMLGAFWLDRVGLLDIELLYIPETFVLAQALGGVLFGAGFLLSGLCPGTSCVAAASGRLDGLAVVGGILGGVVLFNLAYDFLSPVYSATGWGRITLAQLAGVPTGVMVSAVTAFALGAFMVLAYLRLNDSVDGSATERSSSAGSEGESGTRIEGERSAKDNAPALRGEAVAPDTRIKGAAFGTRSLRARVLVTAAAALGVGAAALDLRSPAEASSPATTAPSERDYISAIDLGERIARADATLRLIDLRDPTEYERFHIPSATRTTLDDLSTAPLPSEATVVLYDNTGVAAAQAQALLRRRGHPSVLVLREGLYEWIARVHEPRLAADATPAERLAFESAAKLSRFFGGAPQAGVPRADVQRGYWNGAASSGDAHARLRDAVAAVRRRGC